MKPSKFRKDELSRDQIRMESDYTTSTFNQGERTYKAGGIYQMTPAELLEIEQSGAGVRLTETNQYKFPPDSPVRAKVKIMSKVTRWISANGHDTHYLKSGEAKTVPSNLAAYLVSVGLATATY